jgi:hypothetical protein
VLWHWLSQADPSSRRDIENKKERQKDGSKVSVAKSIKEKSTVRENPTAITPINPSLKFP